MDIFIIQYDRNACANSQLSFTCGFLTHSHTITSFDSPGKQAFENTVGKGDIAYNKQFLLYSQCFLPI